MIFATAIPAARISKRKTGKDPLEMEHPDQSPAWRKYRYEQVNGIVNHLADIAHAHNKPITAAVFSHTGNCAPHCSSRLDQLEP